MPSPLLGALGLKCNNTAYRPAMGAIDLLQRYLDRPLMEGAFFDPTQSVPLAGDPATVAGRERTPRCRPGPASGAAALPQRPKSVAA